MKLIDYNPEDQVYFIESFLNRCQNVCEKIKSENNGENPSINQFMLSQIMKKTD